MDARAMIHVEVVKASLMRITVAEVKINYILFRSEVPWVTPD